MIRYFRQKIDFPSCLAVVLLATAMTASAQSSAQRDFKEIDANIRIYPDNQPINSQALVSELISGLSDSTDRVRAIYVWIAKNISYDLAAYRFSGKESHPADDILQTRKAICSGYSLLFQRLCEIAGIEAVVIEGYAKGYGYKPFQKFLSSNHAWNAVFLDGEWHFVDVTWAAGLPREITGKTPAIDLDAYFFIPPEKLIKTHLPEDPTWQLQDKKISLTDFESGISNPDEASKPTEEALMSPAELDEFDIDIIKYKRSLSFNQRNEGLRARLSFAYVYKAISMTDGLWKFSYIELVDRLPGMEKVFLAYLDSAQQVMNTSMYNIKDQKIIGDEINFQKGVFYYELAANIFGKANKSQGVSAADRMLIDGFFTNAEGHFKAVPSESIYYPDAQKYLGNIADYQMKKKG
ncbi:MAG: transglutaminase domain-containing protein [Cyclobacteriaceae bacterium]|nr:transglutaminase domain-containing protein [Cyclobacteriaceae bacterium]